MRRYELTDEQWELIEDIFPGYSGTGRPPTESRIIMNGLFWILNSGAPWRDMPDRYGPWQTVYGRFRQWQKDGTWDKVMERLQLRLDEQGYLDWDLWCIDGTTVRAHRSAAGAGKKGAPTNPKITLWAAHEAVGAPKSIWLLTAEAIPSLSN